MSFGLYLHFPFCRNHCSYCDFYKLKHAVDREREYFDALKIETELAAQKLSAGPITSIYVGGGTPSLSNLDLFAEWYELATRVFGQSPEVEFSFETNPESASLRLQERLHLLGVNRPLFGVQSFNAGLLALLGRQHNPRDSHQAIYHARALGFRNFGIDLIFGLPGQIADQHTADLEQALDLAPPHISYYQLTVEPKTELSQMIDRGLIRPLDPEVVAAMYREGRDKLTEAGYVHYEVSSFAREGYECRHNQGYWDGSDYLGLGPAAHSFVDGKRFYNPSSLQEYTEKLASRDLPWIEDTTNPMTLMTEAIMLGLRTSQGVDRARYQGRYGSPVEERLNMTELDSLVDSGHVISDKRTLRLTDEGLCLADEITARLLK